MLKSFLLVLMLGSLTIGFSGCLSATVDSNNNEPDIPVIINKAENVSTTIEERDQNAAKQIEEIEENF